MAHLRHLICSGIVCFTSSLTVLVNSVALAEENINSPAEQPSKKLEDMSDPLAVYTRVGAGTTNLGLNLKMGVDYDTGKESTQAMHVLEVKGALGETLGWGDDDKRDNSIDNFRYRNFLLNKKNGRGTQIDVNYVFDESHIAKQSGDVSYSLIQGFNPVGQLNLYPLIGGGLAFGNDSIEDDGSIDSGYSINGTFFVVGMYAKYAINDNIWVNYNPLWVSTLSGSGVYKDNAYGVGNSSLLTHEVAIGYKISPRMNVRYYGNWHENNNFSDGVHKIEVNYQL